MLEDIRTDCVDCGATLTKGESRYLCCNRCAWADSLAADVEAGTISETGASARWEMTKR
jgi:hypothetical protein